MQTPDTVIAVYGTGDVPTKAAVALLDDYVASLDNEPTVVCIFMEDSTSDDVAYRIAQHSMQESYSYSVVLGSERKPWMKEVLESAQNVYTAPTDPQDVLVALDSAAELLEVVLFWAWDDDDPKNDAICKLLEETKVIVTPLDYSEGLYPIEFEEKFNPPIGMDEALPEPAQPAKEPAAKPAAKKAAAKPAKKDKVAPHLEFLDRLKDLYVDLGAILTSMEEL